MRSVKFYQIALMTLEPELYYSVVVLCITIMCYVIMHYVNLLSCDLILLPCCLICVLSLLNIVSILLQ